MKLFFTIFFLFFYIFNTFADEELKEKVDQFDNWNLVCVTQDNNEKCEINHTIEIENTELSLRIVYQLIKNENLENLIEMFSIITPLGVNLTKNTALIFPEDKGQINLSFIKCEAYGCILAINNMMQDSEELKVFEILKKNLLSQNEFSIFLDVFMEEPLKINGSLKGFEQSLEALKSKV